MAKKEFSTDRLFTQNAPAPAVTAQKPILSAAQAEIVNTMEMLFKKHITTITRTTLYKQITGASDIRHIPAKRLNGIKAALAELCEMPEYDGITARIIDNPKTSDPRINLRLTTDNMDYLQELKWTRRTSVTDLINEIIEEYRISHD